MGNKFEKGFSTVVAKTETLEHRAIIKYIPVFDKVKP